ncbi:hypothetical protein TB2_043957 [Malus domestica]
MFLAHLRKPNHQVVVVFHILPMPMLVPLQLISSIQL